MTRIVTRRPKYKTQPDKNSDAYPGMCGWCIGPVGARLPHIECAGMTSVTFTCLCKVCYGPDFVPPPTTFLDDIAKIKARGRKT